MMGGSGGMGDMPAWMVTGMGIAAVMWLLVGIAVLVLVVIAVLWLAIRLRRDVAKGGTTSHAIYELDPPHPRGEPDRSTCLQMRRGHARTVGAGPIATCGAIRKQLHVRPDHS